MNKNQFVFIFIFGSIYQGKIISAISNLLISYSVFLVTKMNTEYFGMNHIWGYLCTHYVSPDK